MGSIGIYKADDVNELDVFYHKVSNEIKNSYLKHESGSDINSAILIQQYITGDEFGIEVINDLKNNYVNTFCKKKIAMRSGETDLALTIESASLADMGKVLSDKLKHTLILDVDCFELDGLYYVLEMNARFGGQYPFSHLAGANLPKQVIEWCNNGETINDLVSINFNVLSGKNIEPVRIDNATS
jgi:carbamoyl-phosphate synthase large subunit